MSNKGINETLEHYLSKDGMDHLSSSANLWFIAFEICSLALALYQTENLSLQINIGLINFVVAGIFFYVFELAKHHKRYDLQIATFTFLRWYTYALIGAALGTGLWYGFVVISYPFIETLDVWIQLVTLIVCMIPFFIFSFFLTRRKDRQYLHDLYNMQQHNQQRKTTIVSIATMFVPTSGIFLFSLFYFNSGVYLSTLGGEIFLEAILTQAASQPLLWSITFVSLIVAIVLDWRMTLIQQNRLIDELQKI